MKFVVLAILTLFLIPWTRSSSKLRAVDKKGDKKVVKGKKSSILVIPVLFWIGIAIYEYFWLIDDRVDSILTHYSVAVAILIGLVLFSQRSNREIRRYIKRTSNVYFTRKLRLLWLFARYSNLAKEI